MISVTFTSDIENITCDTHVYQWDNKRTIEIKGLTFDDTPVVHFANKMSKSAIVVEPTIANGVLIADIPNSLLCEPHHIIAYVYSLDDNQCKTVKTVFIPLEKRPKPDDFVFEGNAGVIALAEINAKVDALIVSTNAHYDAYVQTKNVELNGFMNDKTTQINNFIASQNADREAYQKQLDDQFAEFQNNVSSSHNHDDKYYTEAEIDNKLEEKTSFQDVEDALAKVVRIGDILYTERVPNLDEFVECNGASLDVNAYPELYDIIGKKYGHSGDVPKTICSYTSPSYLTKHVKLPNGNTVVEYYDNDKVRTWRHIFDSVGNQVASYEVTTTSGYTQGSNYPNTMVALPNGDVIAKKDNEGSLIRIKNIADPNNATYSDISGLSFGGKYVNSYGQYNCTAQIVHDGNGTYYILAPIGNPARDEDDQPYWTEKYSLYSTTDFATFTQMIAEFQSADGNAKKLVAVNGKIFLLPNAYRNIGGGRVYMLSNGSFVEQTGMRYLENLVYVNGHYFAAHNYDWDNTESGIYVAGEDLVFTQLYAGTTWGNTFYGRKTGNGSFDALLTARPEANEIVILSWYEYGSSYDATEISVFKVNDDGTLTKVNDILSLTGDDAYMSSWLISHGDLVFYHLHEQLKYCLAHPTHFNVPERWRANGGSSSTTLTNNPTPYIKAKDVV